MPKKTSSRKPAPKSRKAKSAKKAKASSKSSSAKPAPRMAKSRPRKTARKSAAKPRMASAPPAGELRSASLSRGFYEGKVELEDGDPIQPRGTGSESAGQSGDVQGLSEIEGSESESVEELVEDGQDFEAELVAGVERAGDSPDSGVPIHQRKTEFDPEDSVSATPIRRGRRRSS